MKTFISENLPTILGYLFGVGGMFDSYLQRLHLTPTESVKYN